MVSSIRRFLTPIVFDGENSDKTLQQRALELVDEYFNLGGVHQVTIFSPDETCDQFYSRENAEVSNRSWINVALKIASYCTGILPLLAVFAKWALRSCLPNIGSEPTKAERVQNFFRKENLSIEDATKKLLEVLGSDSNEDVLCLDHIMNFFDSDGDGDFDGIHNTLVEELTSLPEGSLTAASLGKFIRYLGDTSLEGLYPWYVYEILNKYEGLCKSVEVDLRSYVKEYLARRAETLICCFDEGNHLFIQMTLAQWFEPDVERMNLQVQEDVSEAIKGRIEGLRNTYCKPIIVELCTPIEASIIKRPALAGWMLQNEVIIVDHKGMHEIANLFSYRVVSTIADAKKLLTPRPNNPQDV